MCIAEEHYNNGKTDAYFGSCHHHNKEYKQLPFTSGCWICRRTCQMVHFGKRHQQQVNGIQHQLNTHEYDNGIAAGEHADNSDNKQGY